MAGYISFFKLDKWFTETFSLDEQKYNGRNSSVEGDYSNASFLGAFNHLGGNIQINNLNPYSYQGDKVYEEYFTILEKSGQKVDISNCIDLGPVLMAYCAIKAGGTLTGTKRLKIKESNRGLAMKEELEKGWIRILSC